MNDLIYKTMNKIFRLSNESKKLLKPSFNELLKFKDFKKSNYNKFAISFSSGRSGQNWFTKIFNSHSNWVGTCERFADYEAFFRYICYYNLPINKDPFFKLINLSAKRDMCNYQNTLISSPYFSFGLKDLLNNLDVDYIFFNIRNPINTVEDLFQKGWYENIDFVDLKSPTIDHTNDLYHSFSRILPKCEYKYIWKKLTRIGKITWFWSITNHDLYSNFSKIKKIEKFYIKLEDIDQNFEMYEKLSDKFNFTNKMSKKKFLNVIYKAGNKGEKISYKFKEWSKKEKKEFEEIREKFFYDYHKIKTNI